MFRARMISIEGVPVGKKNWGQGSPLDLVSANPHAGAEAGPIAIWVAAAERGDRLIHLVIEDRVVCCVNRLLGAKRHHASTSLFCAARSYLTRLPLPRSTTTSRLRSTSFCTAEPPLSSSGKIPPL